MSQILCAAINDPSETVIECAARALGTIGSAAKSSLPTLESKIGQRSIMLLGEMGPAASNAVPLLKVKAGAEAAVPDNTTKEFREAIQNAARDAPGKITNAP